MLGMNRKSTKFHNHHLDLNEMEKMNKWLFAYSLEVSFFFFSNEKNNSISTFPYRYIHIEKLSAQKGSFFFLFFFFFLFKKKNRFNIQRTELTKEKDILDISVLVVNLAKRILLLVKTFWVFDHIICANMIFVSNKNPALTRL